GDREPGLVREPAADPGAVAGAVPDLSPGRGEPRQPEYDRRREGHPCHRPLPESRTRPDGIPSTDYPAGPLVTQPDPWSAAILAARRLRGRHATETNRGLPRRVGERPGWPRSRRTGLS